MINVWPLIRTLLRPEPHIWVTVTLITETPKAVLIRYNDREAWLPKAWIVRIKPEEGVLVQIKISEYHWMEKFG